MNLGDFNNLDTLIAFLWLTKHREMHESFRDHARFLLGDSDIGAGTEGRDLDLSPLTSELKQAVAKWAPSDEPGYAYLIATSLERIDFDEIAHSLIGEVSGVRPTCVPS